MKRIFAIAMSVCVFPLMGLKAQFAGNTYVCDQESFQRLKDLSNSSLKNGDIYVFTTTHQDLAWLNHLDACIADRDTLWLTPFLKRLEEDPTSRWILNKLLSFGNIFIDIRRPIPYSLSI